MHDLPAQTAIPQAPAPALAADATGRRDRDFEALAFAVAGDADDYEISSIKV